MRASDELLGYSGGGSDFITTPIGSPLGKEDIYAAWRRRIKDRDTFAKRSLRVLPSDALRCFFSPGRRGVKKGANGRVAELRNFETCRGDVLRPARSIIAESCLRVFFLEHDHAPATTSYVSHIARSRRNLSCSSSYLQVTSSRVRRDYIPIYRTHFSTFHSQC